MFLHGGPWGYAIVWELVTTICFVVPYGAVAIAIAKPIKVRKKRISDFARGAARLLSAADEPDHLDLISDLQKSLPVLIKSAQFLVKQ